MIFVRALHNITVCLELIWGGRQLGGGHKCLMAWSSKPRGISSLCRVRQRVAHFCLDDSDLNLFCCTKVLPYTAVRAG